MALAQPCRRLRLQFQAAKLSLAAALVLALALTLSLAPCNCNALPTSTTDPSEASPPTENVSNESATAETDATPDGALNSTTPPPPPPATVVWPGVPCPMRGCIKSGAFGVTWRPEPCTTCYCDAEGRERCYERRCPKLDCFGYPNKTEPWACCPVCDFGVPDDRCGAVPARREALYVALGDAQCHAEVVTQDCNKRVVYRDGEWYKCVAAQKRNRAVFLEGCESMRKVVVKSIPECTEEKADPHRDIPQDYDPFPNACTMVV